MKNGDKTILIIDDQASIRYLLGSFLNNQYRVIGFEDGFSAMQWLASANIPDLILLDLNVPRLSGQDFLAQIKRSGFFQDIPVVIISGDDTKETKDFCDGFGVDAYLVKPFDPVKLNEIVKNIFAEQSDKVAIEQNEAKPILKKLIRLKK